MIFLGLLKVINLVLILISVEDLGWILLKILSLVWKNDKPDAVEIYDGVFAEQISDDDAVDNL